MANNRKVRRRNIPKTEQEIEVKIPEPVKIDFSKASERAGYIKKKLDDILENIGESYGKRLTDELIKRLEKTVKDFHAEVSKMLDKLHEIEEKREIKEKEIETDISTSDEEALPEDFDNMSEVEKRLEMKEREKEKKSDTKGINNKSEVSKKRGIFKKKKKK